MMRCKSRSRTFVAAESLVTAGPNCTTSLIKLKVRMAAFRGRPSLASVLAIASVSRSSPRLVAMNKTLCAASGPINQPSALICGLISAYLVERRRLSVDHLTMTIQASSTTLKQPDATALLIKWLRKPDHGQYGSYGYGVYVPNLARVYLENNGTSQTELAKRVGEMMPMLYAAAWELCRRGILRPGVEAYLGQGTSGGAAGD